MSETYSESATHTFTMADVGRVLDCFAADFDVWVINRFEKP